MGGQRKGGGDLSLCNYSVANLFVPECHIHMIPKMHLDQNADDGDRGHEEEMCNPLLIRLNGDLSGTTCPTHDDSLAPLPHNQCPTLLNTLSLHFTCVKVRTFGTFPCFPSICKFARPRRTLHCESV